MMFRQGAQYEASTVAARLTGLLLNDVSWSCTHNLCVIFLVVLTFILNFVLVGFLEISYHILSMTHKVREAYEGVHLSNILVYEAEHITKKRRMWVIKVSFSQQGCFHASMVEWKTTDCDNRMGYKTPFIPPKVTATCNILNDTLIYSISLLAAIVVYKYLGSQNMSTNGSPPKTANMARPVGPFGMQQRPEDSSESSDNSSGTATGKDSPFGTQSNQCHLPHGYGYLPSQQPFPGTLQFYQQSPFNLTHSSQPTTSASQEYPSYGPH